MRRLIARESVCLPLARQVNHRGCAVSSLPGSSSSAPWSASTTSPTVAGGTSHENRTRAGHYPSPLSSGPWLSRRPHEQRAADSFNTKKSRSERSIGCRSGRTYLRTTRLIYGSALSAITPCAFNLTRISNRRSRSHGVRRRRRGVRRMAGN